LFDLATDQPRFIQHPSCEMG